VEKKLSFGDRKAEKKEKRGDIGDVEAGTQNIDY